MYLALSKLSRVRNPFEVSAYEVGEDICGFQDELLELQAINRVSKEHFYKCV